MAQATAQVKGQYAAESSGNPYPSAVSASSLKGKSFWVIELYAGNPVIVAYSEAFQAAAAAAGATVHIFDGKATPAIIVQGMNTAIAAKADGIVTEAVDDSTIQQPLAAAAAAGIPVIDAFAGDPKAPFAQGIVGHVTPDYNQLGDMQADYALHDTGCKTHAVIVGTLSNTPSLLATNSTKAEVARLCPSGCSTDVLDIEPNDIATQLSGRMETLLQRNPDVNVIIDAADAYVPYIAHALSALQRKIPIVSASGDAIALGQSGGPLVADYLYPPAQVLGWFFFDGMVKVLNGDKDFAVPLQWALFDKTNWGTNPSPTALQPRYGNYQATFKKLWGLGG